MNSKEYHNQLQELEKQADKLIAEKFYPVQRMIDQTRARIIQLERYEQEENQLYIMKIQAIVEVGIDNILLALE